MGIAIGDTLPDADLLRPGAEGPRQASLADLLGGKTAVLFGVPGAFTGTCTTAHLPSFLRNRDAFAEKGVDAIYCLAVNDPFVMAAWDEATGATAGGVEMVADPESRFVTETGLRFDAPQVGLIGRAKRFTMLLEDRVVRQISVEENPGVCEVTAGEALLKVL